MCAPCAALMDIASSSSVILTLDGIKENQTNLGTDAKLVGNQAIAHVDNLRLYNVVADSDYNQRTLVLNIQGKGFKIYTFTFG